MSQPRQSAPEPTEIAGRYEVVKKLGAGAFGTVYKAKDKILGRMVAIKTIRLEGLAAAGASLDELIDRFKREARVSAQLKHPNIVTIYDVGDSDGMSYLAMEFIDGTGLERVIAQAGRLPLERVANIGAQVADALDFAHKGSVVHRDIKPANIMIEAGDRVKVTDFGIAKVTDSAEHLTMTGSLLGTPSYMSPEQARGLTLDGRSDLFAVGCVLYEMLVGKKAFRGDSITGLIFKIITEEPPDIRELDPDVPDEMVRIIAKALSKAPETRYQNGRELADDLQALMRPGTTPTIRQVEVATAGILPAMGGAAAAPALTSHIVPTIAAPPTMAGSPPPTVAGTTPTVGSTPPRPTSAPPRPPAPPAHATPAAASPRAMPTSRGPQARPAPASSRAGLFVGIAAAGLVLLMLAAGLGWYVYNRRASSQVATGSVGGSAGTRSGTLAPSPAAVATAPPGTSTTAPVTEPAASGGDVGGPATTMGAAPPSTLANPGPGTTHERAAGRTAPATKTAGGEAGPGAAGGTTPAEEALPPPSKGGDYAFLDAEPEGDGREAGERLADTYRNRQGPGTSRGSFGTNRVFRQKERSPRNLGPVEAPAVATIRHIITREELFHKKEGKYGSLADLRASGFALDVPFAATSFQRKGYKFELTVEEDGFKVIAMPHRIGPRAFMGDDSGYIRAGLE